MTNLGNKYLLRQIKEHKIQMTSLEIQNKRLMDMNHKLESQLLKFQGPLLRSIRELLNFRKR